MKDRGEFLRALTPLGLTHAARSIALLWYYRQTQEFEERTAADLASDLQDEGFPKPHVTRLNDDLRRSRFVVRGRRPRTFQLDARRLNELDERYMDVLSVRRVEVGEPVLPREWVAGTRVYLEKLFHQINGTYEYGFYDACATLCRRLIESLLVEIYIHEKRHHEVQFNGVFLGLDRLIAHARHDSALSLGRNTPKVMTEIKELGDTAAHDRVYITLQADIDDVRARFRRVVRELLELAGIS